jgi:hypothetical protein
LITDQTLDALYVTAKVDLVMKEKGLPRKLDDKNTFQAKIILRNLERKD